MPTPPGLASAPAVASPAAAVATAPPAAGLTPSGEPLGLTTPKLDAPGTAAAPANGSIGSDDAKVLLNSALSRTKHDAPAAAAAPTTTAERKRADDVVIVDAGVDEEAKAPKTLVEAARAERARRANTGQSKIVINDKNIHQYAKKGQITVAAAPKPATAAAAVPGVPAADPSHDEQYWRHGALTIRRRWRSAYDRAKDLEKSAADWRIRFYAQDDPYVRDGQIKPSWDRALEMLKEAQNEVDISQKDLANFLDQGRREGALPGWLREGVEEEPPLPPKPVKPGDAIEPPMMKDPGA
jgi:hypothetical protein